MTAKNRRARGYIGGITVDDIELTMDAHWSCVDVAGMARTYSDTATGHRFEITTNRAGYVETLYYQGKFSTELKTPLNDIIRKILRRKD